jgi:hypothetical protein
MKSFIILKNTIQPKYIFNTSQVNLIQKDYKKSIKLYKTLYFLLNDYYSLYYLKKNILIYLYLSLKLNLYLKHKIRFYLFYLLFYYFKINNSKFCNQNNLKIILQKKKQNILSTLIINNNINTYINIKSKIFFNLNINFKYFFFIFYKFINKNININNIKLLIIFLNFFEYHKIYYPYKFPIKNIWKKSIKIYKKFKNLITNKQLLYLTLINTNLKKQNIKQIKKKYLFLNLLFNIKNNILKNICKFYYIKIKYFNNNIINI